MRRIVETITVENQELARAIIKGIEGIDSARGGFYECTIDEIIDKNYCVVATKIQVVEVGVKP